MKRRPRRRTINPLFSQLIEKPKPEPMTPAKAPAPQDDVEFTISHGITGTTVHKFRVPKKEKA